MASTGIGWNQALGVRSSSTDPNGLVTSWQHDPFGRMTRETRQRGNNVAWKPDVYFAGSAVPEANAFDSRPEQLLAATSDADKVMKALNQVDRVHGEMELPDEPTGDWRAEYRAERRRRMTTAQQERLRALEELPHRTEEQEVELLTLSWFTDHADPGRGWHWAAEGARHRRPVNWSMNAELGRDGRADPLDDHLAELRARLPARAELLGGADDPRPLSALDSLALQLDLPLTRVEDAGHEPWLEQPDAVRAHLRRFVRDAVGA